MESRRPASAPPSPEQDWWWIFDPRLSLRARAALIFGGSALLFTVLFSGLAATLLRRSLERQVGAGFETLAFQMSDKLDRVIHQRFHELQLAADVASFRAASASPADRKRLLESLQDTTRDFAWIGFADAGGLVRASTRGIFDGTSVELRPWFRAGGERPYVGPLTELPALARELATSEDDRGTRFIELGVPVHSPDGKFLGVVGALLHWDWAREVQFSVVPETARRERIGVTVYNTNGEVLLDSGASGWTQPPEPPAITDARRFRGTMLETPASGGEAYVTGFARSRGYREFRGLGWLIVVRQPAGLALAPARELQRVVGGWGIVFTALVLVVSWIAAGQLTRRLRSVTGAAERIRQGDILTVMPVPRGEGEVAQMCGALGEMVAEFRAKQDELEAKAREREKPRA